MNKGGRRSESIKNAFFGRLSRRVCIYRAQRRADARRSTVSRARFAIGRQSPVKEPFRGFLSWYSAAEARRPKGKGANAALLPGVCECAGVGESRSGEDVEDDDSGAVCSSCYLSREAEQDAICAGGRLDRWRLWRAVLMRRPRVAACCVERGRECGSVRLSSRVGLPACLPACPSAVCRVLSRSLALTDFLMCVAGVALVCRSEGDSLP